ncbi:uncharacterized protein LOC110243971 [Exaiptasia diaphana]|uniref:isocitrate lyase n=1 Tax=Exaiptasia diaphana TaxID=2652724 RepID=A0A913XJH8_EXADI|nr:uncharacterized protein LOC110243971 [Exaiptasia diaphana]KXJ11277.1 Isocitrate lyase [Exaiptasia diaphana]
MASNYTYEKRWAGIKRNYGPEEVERLRGTVKIEYSLAKRGADRLWEYITRGGDSYINALGALTGGQAIQMAKAGLKAIYLSGWQVAADANDAGQTYPDQSLYPAHSAPKLVQRINNAFMRADQISHMEGDDSTDFFLPIVADCEAGFGGPLNAFEITKNMIVAGAAGVHFEDQLASEKKCGHMGGKVLVPTMQFIKVLNAVRLASDIMDVPLVIVGRTDANAAALVTSDIDPYDRPFLTGERTPEGFFRAKAGLDQAIARGLAYAPYCDVLWCETGKPNLEEARKFANAIHSKFPGKPLAYNCSPSFNWKANLSDDEIAVFQKELGRLGYRFQFVTLAGFHSLNHAMFKLAHDYKRRGMSAYTQIQEDEFKQSKNGFTAHKHQREVGTSYFDSVGMAISGGLSSTSAMKGSTEEEQFVARSTFASLKSSL